MENTNILRNAQLMRKFCQKYDRAMGCSKAFGIEGQPWSCQRNNFCPLAVASEVEFLMENKRMTLGDALRLTLNRQIDRATAEKILDEYSREKRTYPEEITKEGDPE